MAEALRAICELDLSELESIEPPRGFGRDDARDAVIERVHRLSETGLSPPRHAPRRDGKLGRLMQRFGQWPDSRLRQGLSNLDPPKRDQLVTSLAFEGSVGPQKEEIAMSMPAAIYEFFCGGGMARAGFGELDVHVRQRHRRRKAAAYAANSVVRAWWSATLPT